MNLTTTYMGLKLKHPLIASASPLSRSADQIKRLEDAGAAAVVMFSLFEEQIKHESNTLAHFQEHGTESFAEALSYFPQIDQPFKLSSDQYLETLHQASRACQIPILGSLNGITTEGWIRYARKMQEAGAAGIELNVYSIAANPTLPGAAVEQRYLDVLKAVKYAVDVPVALKLSPFFSSMAHMARQFDQAGADALVLFNRFYQPDLDLEALEVVPNLQFSTPFEIRLPLMWIALLYGKIKASLAATSGVHSGLDALKYLMAGADVVMTTSALLQHGVSHLRTLLQQVREWMESHEYESVSQMKGSMSQRNVTDPSAFERANYIKVLESYKGEYLAS